MLDCERYIGLAVAGSRRKMVCWVGVLPRPGPVLPPLEGGGRQPCTGLLVVLPLARKSPVRAPLRSVGKGHVSAGMFAGCRWVQRWI